MSVVLVVNPRTDREFAAVVDRLAVGADSPRDLQDRLRPTYPRCVVRARSLSFERWSVWYVYREGHWIPSRIHEGSTD